MCYIYETENAALETKLITSLHLDEIFRMQSTKTSLLVIV